MFHRTWEAFSLQPHRIETFKPSIAPHFVEYVHDIAGLYPNPAERGVVLCVDERKPDTGTRTHAALLAKDLKEIEQRSHDYTCSGAFDEYISDPEAT